MAEASDAVSIPHAYGRFPLNIGAGVLPLFWGLFNGVITGVWVQLGVALLWVGGVVARKQSEPALVVIGWVLAALCVILNVWFALVADRLAWKSNPERDAGEYVKAQRLWAVGAPIWVLITLWYRSDL